jgi:hypothetical protein
VPRAHTSRLNECAGGVSYSELFCSERKMLKARCSARDPHRAGQAPSMWLRCQSGEKDCNLHGLRLRHAIKQLGLIYLPFASSATRTSFTATRWAVLPTTEQHLDSRNHTLHWHANTFSILSASLTQNLYAVFNVIDAP